MNTLQGGHRNLRLKRSESNQALSHLCAHFLPDFIQQPMGARSGILFAVHFASTLRFSPNLLQSLTYVQIRQF